MRVLIADDDPTCREIARLLLGRAGHEVTAVADGAAARAALLGAPFAAALLDLQMPELDGAAVARAVRAALPAGRLPRLIALTAWADPSTEARLLAYGFDACLGKPIRSAALLAAIDAPAPGATLPLRPPTLVAAPAGAVAPPRLALPDARDMAQVGAFAQALLRSEAAEAQPQLAGLCARLAAAARAGQRASVDELMAAIDTLLRP